MASQRTNVPPALLLALSEPQKRSSTPSTTISNVPASSAYVLSGSRTPSFVANTDSDRANSPITEPRTANSAIAYQQLLRIPALDRINTVVSDSTEELSPAAPSSGGLFTQPPSAVSSGLSKGMMSHPDAIARVDGAQYDEDSEYRYRSSQDDDGDRRTSVSDEPSTPARTRNSWRDSGTRPGGLIPVAEEGHKRESKGSTFGRGTTIATDSPVPSLLAYPRSTNVSRPSSTRLVAGTSPLNPSANQEDSDSVDDTRDEDLQFDSKRFDNADEERDLDDSQEHPSPRDVQTIPVRADAHDGGPTTAETSNLTPSTVPPRRSTSVHRLILKDTNESINDRYTTYGSSVGHSEYARKQAVTQKIPKSSYYVGPPGMDSAFGTGAIGQIGVHYPREMIRVERDYSAGELPQFYPTYPLELEGRVTPTQFQDSINQINEVLISAYSIQKSAMEHLLGVMTLYLSVLIRESHYDKEMRRLHKIFENLNTEIFNPAGLNLLWPRRTAFMFLEIEYY